MSRRRNEPQGNTELVNEAAERAIVGISLNDVARFWEAYNRLRPEHFTTPRLARIWNAMCGLASDGKKVNANWIPVKITGESEDEQTPIAMFLSILMNDAPPSSEADAYIEMVMFLANKRAMLASLDRARNDVLRLDIGTPAEHMKDVGIQIITKAFDGDSDGDMMTYGQWGESVARTVQAAYDQGEEGGYGLEPGLRAVEEVMGRLLPGKLYVIAGMSGGGKSAISRQIMEHATVQGGRQGKGHGYMASLEMTGDEYAARALAEQIGIAADRIERGDLNPAEIDAVREAVKRLRKIPLVIDQRPRLTMDGIRSRALKIKNQGGLSIMAIDHLLLVKQSGRADGLLDRVSEVTIESKNMAKEFGVPVILLAQLDEKRLLESPSGWPNSSHLFGGQTINQNADAIVFVHRPEVITAKKEPSEADVEKHLKWVARMDDQRGRAYIYTNKRRGGQPNRKMEMRFHGMTMQFEDI